MKYSITLEYCGKKTEECGDAPSGLVLAAGDRMIENALKECE
ncbi:MAG: hypothetical protein NT067_00720 [Candidatus Diapherotrites archaeon]|nr:hypothetical protein [Candidatus Diapherotrites archaeon]